MQPKFQVPEWAKPWASKVVNALLVAGAMWLVMWLKGSGIDAEIPAIKAEVQAARAEIQELRASGTLFIEKK
jgi:hypothetical protein